MVGKFEKYPKIELPKLTDRIVETIRSAEGKFFIIANISNPDMVGHTAGKKASVKAAEAVDAALRRISEAAKKRGAMLFITADHGNLECVETEDGIPSTFHTRNHVPFAVLGDDKLRLKKGGCLKDVAPTVLYIMEPGKKKVIDRCLRGKVLVKK